MSKINHYFISGSIGVGKTTYINHLYKLMKGKCTLIKEYIDYDSNGVEMLSKWHLKKITTFQFQNYIIDCFIKQLENKTENILIWERHPLETIDIFCRQKQCLTKEEKFILLKKLKVMMETYNIPQSIENYRIFYINCFEDNFIKKGYDYIMNYLHFQPKLCLVIYLGIDVFHFSIQIDNIIKRNRLIEKNTYTTQEGMNALWKLNFTYHQYWSLWINKCSKYSTNLNEAKQLNEMHERLIIEYQEYTTSYPNAEVIMSQFKKPKPFFGSGEWWKTQN